MKKASLAHAKAHLSEYVDAAEHRGVSTVIQRHGKPAAILSPVPKKKAKKRMTPEEFEKLLVRIGEQGDPDFPAVQDMIDGRR